MERPSCDVCCTCGGRESARVEEEGMHVWRKRECTCGGRESARVEEEGVHVWRKRECTCGGRGSARVDSVLNILSPSILY